MAAELLVRPRRVDLAAWSADVRLEAELGVGAERAEVRDEARGCQRSLEDLIGPGQRVICSEAAEDRCAVRRGDRRDRNRDGLRTDRGRRDRRAERSRDVVVEHDADRAGALRVDRLDVEPAGPSADESDLAHQ